MVQYQDAVLDRVFSALSDSTRRGVLDALGRGSVAVSALAAPHGMSLTGFMKHLRVLEGAGLIERNKEGRVVSCELSAAPMKLGTMRTLPFSNMAVGGCASFSSARSNP